LPIRQRVRRSSPLMWQDPFTLIIALSKEGQAKGQLYLDDGIGYGYQSGEYIWRDFTFSENVLRSTNKASEQSEANLSSAITPYDAEGNIWAKAIAHVGIERIVILGMKSSPKSVKVAGEDVEWTWEAGADAKGKKEDTASRLTVKNPRVGVVGGWEMVFA
jgi:alpha 1,3-glucosidase